MEVVRKLQSVNIDILREEYEIIKNKVKWENGQTSINYRKKEGEDRHLGGCGWHEEYFTRGHVFQKDYVLYNYEYDNTLTKSLLKDFRCYRSRYLTRESGTCYKWHKDDDFRVHIPIYSDPGNFFAFEGGIERLDPGYAYLVNTKRMHTFFNGSKTSRVHIVGNTEYGFRSSKTTTNW